jgi:hypothetical protein
MGQVDTLKKKDGALKDIRGVLEDYVAAMTAWDCWLRECSHPHSPSPLQWANGLPRSRCEEACRRPIFAEDEFVLEWVFKRRKVSCRADARRYHCVLECEDQGFLSARSPQDDEVL